MDDKNKKESGEIRIIFNELAKSSYQTADSGPQMSPSSSTNIVGTIIVKF